MQQTTDYVTFESMSVKKGLVLDTVKLKNLNSGLGQFCLHLGQAIQKHNQNFDLSCLIASPTDQVFGDSMKYIVATLWNRFWGISNTADIWHSFHHGSPYHTTNKKTKRIVTVHDLNFMLKYRGWKRNRELHKLKLEIKQADAVVAISNFTRQEILRYIDVGKKKIAVIYNGLNISMAPAQKPKFILFNKFFFSLGIISEKKNFHVLLPLLKQKDDFSLVIAGNKNGKYAQRLMEEAKQLGVSNRLIMPGEISEGEKLWLYQNCEAFLFPSLQEGFGLPVLEAMNEGKPVFCSNHTALPEVGGPHAYYFTDFHPDSMEAVLSEGLADYTATPGKRIELQNWAKKFSWQEAAKKYLVLYRQLAKN
ncbi:MAG: hypothetical protein OJF59_000766 [Cytophagales bacterium]|nr:MAG: hypothetical protein OJF59_000766 [Cytophagales bacterium]